MLMSCLLPVACLAQGSDKIKSVSVGEFAETVRQKNVVLVDVRTVKEYSDGHIAGSVNVVWTDKTFKEDFEKQKIKNKKIVAVYCRSGRRSMSAAKVLADMGYQVVNLSGGIMAWQKEGKEVVK